MVILETVGGMSTNRRRKFREEIICTAADGTSISKLVDYMSTDWKIIKIENMQVGNMSSNRTSTKNRKWR